MRPISNTSDIERLITNLLKPNGFRKKGNNWYKETDDCIGMINLQKSDWGGQFYLNLAVCITKMGNSSDSPLEHKCPIRRRLDRIFRDRELLLQALNLESDGIRSEDRASIITDAIINEALPWLLTLATLDGIRNRILTDETTDSWITPAAREFLGFKSLT